MQITKFSDKSLAIYLSHFSRIILSTVMKPEKYVETARNEHVEADSSAKVNSTENGASCRHSRAFVFQILLAR